MDDFLRYLNEQLEKEDFRKADRIAEAVAGPAREEFPVADDRLELFLRSRHHVQMRVQNDFRGPGFAVRSIQDVPTGEFLDAAEDTAQFEIVPHDGRGSVDTRRIGRDGSGADELFQQGDRIVHSSAPYSLFSGRRHVPADHFLGTDGGIERGLVDQSARERSLLQRDALLVGGLRDGGGVVVADDR